MFKYAVVEIAGRQYKVTPTSILTVDSLGDQKTIESKVLLLASDKGVEVGTPFLKDTLKLEVVDHSRQPKIRVAKYHAKANTRKVTGSRRHISRVRVTV